MRGCITTNNCTDLTTSVLVANVAPTITSSPPLFAGENQPYSYDAEATDPGGSADALAWTLVRAPSGMTINRGPAYYRLPVRLGTIQLSFEWMTAMVAKLNNPSTCKSLVAVLIKRIRLG